MKPGDGSDVLTVVPDGEDGHVQTFCDKVVPGQKVQRVRCEPDLTAPINECFDVVAAHVARHGGSPVLGWTLWEFPGAYIEAEFHCVWRAPSGILLDVVPRAEFHDEILFLPDPHRVDNGRTIDNIRQALTRDNDVKRFLFLASEHYRILNAGERAALREVSLSARELKHLQGIATEMMRLRNRLAKRYRRVT